MAVKLLALDLDGTVVREDLTISAPVLNALHHVVHHTDTRVVVATGRMYPSALTYVKQIQTLEPIVSYQGSMVTAQDEATTLLHHTPIPLDTAKRVLAFLETEAVNTNVYINNQLYTNHGNDRATYYAKLAGIQPIMVKSLSEILTDAPTKMMVINDNRLDDLMAELRRQFAGEISSIRSRFDFCELIAPTSSKWAAVSFLAQQWGIQPSEVCACGDQENDLSMITGAGIGVAMGNAPAWIQAQADHVVASVDDDGLLEVIEMVLNACRN